MGWIRVVKTPFNLYFNKPIDPQQLDIEVLETVHGEIYAQPEKGTDIRQFSDVKLVEVHRDLQWQHFIRAGILLMAALSM